MLKLIINQYKSQPYMEEDEGGCQKTRDFICACGKNYLSYAALFTHIKQKHDGKAPGPIVRPRSQRKRGRPRKNPLTDQELRNSDSDGAKNGISIVNEIKNINNNNISSFQNKHKQAAQLLGCGQFKGFQTYRPEIQSFSRSKATKQPLKKLGFKKYISNTQKSQPKLMKDETFSENQVPGHLNPTKSGLAENEESNLAHNSYPYNFVIMHLKNMFQGYQPSEQEQTCCRIIEILDWIGQEVRESKGKINQQNQINMNMTIENGLKMFVSLFKQHLEEFQLKQVSFFLSLFYEYIYKQLGASSNFMNLGLKFSDITKYIPTFLFNYLPKKIQELQVGCLNIFQKNNPSNVLIALCNQISIHEAQVSQNMKASLNIQPSQKTQRFWQVQLPQEIRKKSIEKQQSQEEIKFEEINYVFDQLRQSSQNQQNALKENKQQNKDGNQNNQNVEMQQEQINSQELSQNQGSLEDQIQRSSEALESKNEKGQGKVIIEQR